VEDVDPHCFVVDAVQQTVWATAGTEQPGELDVIGHLLAQPRAPISTAAGEPFFVMVT